MEMHVVTLGSEGTPGVYPYRQPIKTTLRVLVAPWQSSKDKDTLSLRGLDLVMLGLNWIFGLKDFIWCVMKVRLRTCGLK